ncbi:MAG: hypothetical protein R3B57_14210 [Phycisphaerales bacterium]
MSTIDAISSGVFAGSPFEGANLARSQRDFSAVLSRARDATGAPAEEVARESAQSLIAITLVQPVLAQLRESSMAAPPFEPTPAEKQFRALQDARLAQDLVRHAKFPLVEQVARGVLKRAGAPAPADAQGGHDARDDDIPA